MPLETKWLQPLGSRIATEEESLPAKAKADGTDNRPRRLETGLPQGSSGEKGPEAHVISDAVEIEQKARASRKGFSVSQSSTRVGLGAFLWKRKMRSGVGAHL